MLCPRCDRKTFYEYFEIVDGKLKFRGFRCIQCRFDRPAKVGVVIPTYNEEENIEPIIRKLEEMAVVDTVFVVDDSNDRTTEILLRLKQEFPNIVVLKREEKLGVGSAIKSGLMLAMAGGMDYVVTMDCDFSHSPEDLPELVYHAVGNGLDLVLGSRYVEHGKIIGWSTYRRIVSFLGNALARRLLQLEVHDCTTGFRVYRTITTLSKLFGRGLVHSGGYEIQVETVHLARKFYLELSEFPITFTERRTGKSKLGKKEIVRFFKYVIKETLHK